MVIAFCIRSPPSEIDFLYHIMSSLWEEGPLTMGTLMRVPKSRAREGEKARRCL